MAVYRCRVCDTIYDENKEGVKWQNVKDDFACPVCESGKSYHDIVDNERVEGVEDIKDIEISADIDQDDLLRGSDQFEVHMEDIHEIAGRGMSIIEPMRTRKAVWSWDDILIKGAQLADIPLNHDEPVETKTIIGPKSKKPLTIEMPLYITHMSFGALSKEAKLALSIGSAAANTAMCSGEGGILLDSLERSYKYIFEYVPNKYSASEDNFRKVDAVEIKIGQSAKPGMGGHLPGNKVTKEIAAIRGFEEGTDIISPSHFHDIQNKTDLKKTVEWLREITEGKPIGIKFAGGNIEDDLEIALFAEPDFITIDGRPGATGASPKFVKQATSIPTMAALYRARKHLNKLKVEGVTLIITGGLRISADFAKALCLGADAIAIGTAALIAIGCQQYRICNTGKCPMGITTQDPKLRARLDYEDSAKRLFRYLSVTNIELKDFARLTGNRDIKKLSIKDLFTLNSDIADHTEIEYAWGNKEKL